MRAFSISFIYIFNLITGLNLTLIIVILAFVPSPIPTFVFNITTLPFSLIKYYNTF